MQAIRHQAELPDSQYFVYATYWHRARETMYAEITPAATLHEAQALKIARLVDDQANTANISKHKPGRGVLDGDYITFVHRPAQQRLATIPEDAPTLRDLVS